MSRRVIAERVAAEVGKYVALTVKGIADVAIQAIERAHGNRPGSGGQVDISAEIQAELVDRIEKVLAEIGVS